MSEKDKDKDGLGVAGTAASVAEPYIERLIIKLVHHFADSRPVTAMLRDLSPDTAQLIYSALPGAVGLAISRIPNSAFKTPERAHFVRSMINEASKNIGEVVLQKAGAAPTPEEGAKAVDDAFKKVEEQKLVLDALGLVHLPDCVRLGQLKPFQRKNVSFKAAIDQGLKAAPCCFPGIEAELKKQAAPPSKKERRKNPSALDIIGGMSSQDRAAFMAWLKTLTREQRGLAIEGLRWLDSDEEFVGFMAMEPQMRLEMLPLLQERIIEGRKVRDAVKKFLGLVGALVKAGFGKAADAAKLCWRKYWEFDAGLAAAVEAEIKRFKTPRPKPKWLRMFLPI